ncbi:unnamed protein product [Protopolystoma xenopodis]|uniref:Uncharacterized protein n=1 Tax=Protopolystoma xenopodis TaxID=117903 RepID=A0A448WA36_9PLAT|nr:unnamed protein product [Protopolystoma xenopodis]
MSDFGPQTDRRKLGFGMSSLADTLSCCLNSWVARQGDSRLEMIRQQTARSHDIDMQLRKEKKYTRKRQMILLLGTGESGKSTFLKQMRIINCKCFSDSEVAQFRITIYDNIYKGILFLIQY